MNSISVVFPTFQDCDEAVATATSIRETAGDLVKIVCIDDGHDAPNFTKELNVTYLKNSQRIGSPASRHLGAMIANRDYIVQCDSHVRFCIGWFEQLQRGIEAHPGAVFCAKMLALETGCMELENHKGSYHGATWCFNGMENNRPKIFEAVWNNFQPGDLYELPAVMGSTYAYPREFYLKLSPHRFLRSFGLEEESLSLKTWLAGGEIRMMKEFVIGHKFRTAKERPQYSIKRHELIYNKIFLILTCLPKQYQERLIGRFKQDGDFRMAMSLIRNDAHLIEVEREHNRQIFTVSFDDFLKKFNLPI